MCVRACTCVHVRACERPPPPPSFSHPPPLFSRQIQHDSGEVGIAPKYLHKGSFVKRILHIATEAHERAPPDFIFVIGDDFSDEKMFSSALSFVAAQSKPPHPRTERTCSMENGHESDEENPLSAAASLSLDEIKAPLSPLPFNAASPPSAAPKAETRVFACTVGKKASLAGCFVEDVREVESLLSKLSEGI